MPAVEDMESNPEVAGNMMGVELGEKLCQGQWGDKDCVSGSGIRQRI
jgi:hypothetical protein